jgi:hypothetical protein
MLCLDNIERLHEEGSEKRQYQRQILKMRRDRPNECRRGDQKEDPKYPGIFPFLFHEYCF